MQSANISLYSFAHIQLRVEMATQSFYEDLILDTPEAVANMEKAFDRYEKEGGYKVKRQARICTDEKVMDSFMKG